MGSRFDQVLDRRAGNSLKWSRYGPEVLPLWVADMDFAAPDPVLDVLRKAVDHGVFGYEIPSRRLLETVAARLHRLYGWQVAPEWVVATPGIVAAFQAAAAAVCERGQGVLVQPPIYPPFLKVPHHTGMVLQTAPLSLTDTDRVLHYSIDWDRFDAGLNSHGAPARMLLLCHPHNPTGRIFSRPELERLVERCLRNDTVICSDEIHSELLLGGATHLPLACLGPEVAERTITLYSPSKSFNVVGLFCGFAIIPNRELRTRYRRVLEDWVLHVNGLGQIAAEAALAGQCDAWLAELREYLTGNRDFLADFVRREFAGVRFTVPDATYLAWLDCGAWVRQGLVEGNVYRFLLDRARVALNPGEDFGEGGENFVRLNFGCPRSTLAEALERIRRALSSAPSELADTAQADPVLRRSGQGA